MQYGQIVCQVIQWYYSWWLYYMYYVCIPSPASQPAICSTVLVAVSHVLCVYSLSGQPASHLFHGPGGCITCIMCIFPQSPASHLFHDPGGCITCIMCVFPQWPASQPFVPRSWWLYYMYYVCIPSVASQPAICSTVLLCCRISGFCIPSDQARRIDPCYYYIPSATLYNQYLPCGPPWTLYHCMSLPGYMHTPQNNLRSCFFTKLYFDQLCDLCWNLLLIIYDTRDSNCINKLYLLSSDGMATLGWHSLVSSDGMATLGWHSLVSNDGMALGWHSLVSSDGMATLGWHSLLSNDGMATLGWHILQGDKHLTIFKGPQIISILAWEERLFGWYLT